VRQSRSREGEGGPVRDENILGGGQQGEARHRAKGHGAEQRKERPPELAGGERRGTSRSVEEVQSGRPADVAQSDRPAGTGVAGVGARSERRNQLKEQLAERKTKLESVESMGDASSNLLVKR
jgi:hypothetical protein